MLTLGEWIKIPILGKNSSWLIRVECPTCGFRHDFSKVDALTQNGMYRYCPKCGQDMKVEDK